MNPPARNAIFALVCLAQVAVPATLIVRHEQTRASGTPWRFQTAPVDPDDPFRGRFVRLAFAVESEAVPFAEPGLIYIGHGQRLYAELEAGPEGYARLVRLHRSRPPGTEYVDVFSSRMRHPDESGEEQAPAAFVRMPFDRYYLPEDRAPVVEREYAEASRAAQANTYAELRVRDGHAALVGLVLDGKPVAAGR